MIKQKSLLKVLIILLCLTITLIQVNFIAFAEDEGRQTTIIVSYTEFEWWLISWIDNQIQCQIFVDHEGLPTNSEVFNACGEDLFDEWQDTPSCDSIEKGDENISECKGFYLHLVSSQQKEREVTIELPQAQVWISLEGCTPIPPENRCDLLPTLFFSGEEPLPNEEITAIHGIYDGEPFSCEEESCLLPLNATPLEGVTVEFWADSSFGDISERFTAQVRVIDSGAQTAPSGGGWFVDILSSQWRGAEPSNCTQTWDTFPPIGGSTDWLASPDQTELLASNDALYYLAGRLIFQGLVDSSECPSAGLLPNGYANACGLKSAQAEVEQWQNQFDARIIETSQEIGVPGQLLKNLFAQESQFWPGVFRVPYEFGLGQITDSGADTIFLWNSSFFEQFCPLVLANETCQEGYLHIKAEDQALLRGALALQAKADCHVCPIGVDLTNVDESISLFANTLQANCEQVAQIIFTATNESAGSVSDFENLWRFTIANYHAGPGCLSYAIHKTWSYNKDLTWENVLEYLTEPCQGVIPYVDKITE